jgi:hypothetical protein
MVVFSFYLLFVPTSLFGSPADKDNASWARRFASSRVHAHAVTAVVATSLSLQLIGGWIPSLSAACRGLLVIVPKLWVGWMLALACTFGLSRDRLRRLSKPAPGVLRNFTLAAVFPAYLIFCGFSPYLGLRTVPAFSMFSNLLTEGQRANHLFVPNLRLASYQDDLVTILRSSHLAGKPVRPFVSLQLQVQRLARERNARNIKLVYTRDGIVHRTRQAERDPVLMARFSWIQRKWLKFRSIDRRNLPNECSW